MTTRIWNRSLVPSRRSWSMVRGTVQGWRRGSVFLSTWKCFIIARGGIRPWGTGAQSSMKSSVLKFNHVSTFLGKGHPVINSGKGSIRGVDYKHNALWSCGVLYRKKGRYRLLWKNHINIVRLLSYAQPEVIKWK